MHGASIRILFFTGAIAFVSGDVVLAAEPPIVVGEYRQLFVDDHLVAHMRGVKRVLNQAKRHPHNPLMVADRPWEGTYVFLFGTVLYDEAEKMFKMWYKSWRLMSTELVNYAVSKDGIRWEKPALGIKSQGDNVVGVRDTHGVIHQPEDPNPDRRYKRLEYLGAGSYSWGAAFSPDGIRWITLPDPQGPAGFKKVLHGAENCSVVYDQQSGRYVAFPKLYQRVRNKYQKKGFERRSVTVAFSDDFVNWSQPQFILVPDARDDELAAQRVAAARGILADDDGPQWYNAQFYGMCGFPYEGMYLGLLWVFDISGGGGNKKFQAGGEDGPIQVELVSSRDLLHWQRVADRGLILPRGPDGTWDGGIIWTSNRPVIVGDEIRIYYGGLAYPHGGAHYTDPGPREKKVRVKGGIGLATLRLDGWVSIDAGKEEGTLTTKPLVFKGKGLVINAKAPKGSVAGESLDEAGKPLSGLGKTDCDAFGGDAIRHRVSWRGKSDLRELAGKIVRLRFHLRRAKLYSFVFQG